MTAALAYIAVTLVLAGCAAYGGRCLGHHRQPGCLRRTLAARATRALLTAAIAVLGISAVRAAVVRARWAWRCRKPPARTDGEKLNRADYLTFVGLVESWRQSGADERSRT